MKRYSWLFLGFLPLLAACPKRNTTPEPDYGTIKQHADKAHSSMDTDSNP